jgi:hypothetical protein
VYVFVRLAFFFSCPVKSTFVYSVDRRCLPLSVVVSTVKRCVSFPGMRYSSCQVCSIRFFFFFRFMLLTFFCSYIFVDILNFVFVLQVAFGDGV